MRKYLMTRCPVCGSELRIRKYYCPECETEIEGNFYFSPLLNLDKKDFEFLCLFLKTRGNLSELAKIMGVSYPTIRVKFEEFLEKIGIEPQPEKPDERIPEILEMLEKGEITVDEAEKRIKEMRG